MRIYYGFQSLVLYSTEMCFISCVFVFVLLTPPVIIAPGGFFCQCGLLGCHSCTDGTTGIDLCFQGLMTVYVDPEECAADCIPKYFCSYGMCYMCCGVGCPACAVVYLDRASCNAGCAQRFHCKTTSGCMPCYGDQCEPQSYSDQNSCEASCEIRYHCLAGHCLSCRGNACSGAVYKTIDDCTSSCGRYHCENEACVACGVMSARVAVDIPAECAGPIYADPQCLGVCANTGVSTEISSNYKCVTDATFSPQQSVCLPCDDDEDAECVALDDCVANPECQPITSRYYCQSGIGCAQCTGTVCLAPFITYSNYDDCYDKCVEKYYCCPALLDGSGLATCTSCYGGECQAGAYGDYDLCVDNCGVCVYGDWSEFSSCTARCNGGLKRRTRERIQGPKTDCTEVSDVKSCARYPCKIDCKVSGWSEWAYCSAKCGEGVETRRRWLTVVPRFGGICPVRTFLQQRSCYSSKKCGGGLQHILKAI